MIDAADIEKAFSQRVPYTTATYVANAATATREPTKAEIKARLLSMLVRYPA
jgi:hypothetical protein